MAGCPPVAELVTRERSGPVDLTCLPDEVVVRCRAAWSRLAGLPRTVIHGADRSPAKQALSAWLAAMFWTKAPEFARRRLAKVD